MNKCDQLDFLTLNDRAVEADKASFCSFIVFLCDYALGELWPWTWDVWGVWFDTCQMAAEGMNGPPMPGDIQIELNDLIWNLNPN